MINNLAAPLVCVVDDEPDDYGPILKVLNRLGVGCVHYSGQYKEDLPVRPFQSLRLIFMDLHLMGDMGVNAASRAAGVFTTIVSPDTAPLIVVIWSKFAAEPALGEPPEAPRTESDAFRETLLEAVPPFRDRVIFAEMPKPKVDDRPENWLQTLEHAIKASLEGKPAVELLWAWEALVRQAGQDVTKSLADLPPADPIGLGEKTEGVLRMLTSADGGVAVDEVSAGLHTSAALAQVTLDQIEHSPLAGEVLKHGEWLGKKAEQKIGVPELNKVLLTGSIADPRPFALTLAMLSLLRPASNVGGPAMEKRFREGPI